MRQPARIATSVLTGFLGSGKTTLLNRMLVDPRLKNAAVLVNEFGEIGIDHLLVRNVDENIVRTSSGCLCCAMRSDMIGTLRDLYARRSRRLVPRFTRMLIETTGLADPAPIVHTLMRDPLIATRFRLDGVVATVDAVNGLHHLERHSESVKQVAMADRLLLTKTDLTQAAATQSLVEQLRDLNPTAHILTAAHGDIDPTLLLDCGLYNHRSKAPDVLRWLNAEAAAVSTLPSLASHPLRHAADIRTFCLTFPAALAWPEFADQIHALIQAHGEHLLRLKGLLDVRGERDPLVIHGVQHLFHPPVRLPAWPDGERRSRIVFITRGLAQEDVVTALRALNPRPYIRTASPSASQA
jgi:G3E family GTPase